MKRKGLFGLFLTVVILAVLIVPAAIPALADGVPLLAGQDIEVGNVTVSNDGDNLYVQYNITEEGWCLTETHVHVATSLEGIPQKNGNPIPGQFEYNGEHDCVTEYTYEIPLTREDGTNWDDGTNLVIAAHAVVMDDSCGETATLYGIARNTGEVYSIDVLGGPSSLEFTIEGGGNSASPNGLGYGGGNFYYTDYQLGTNPDTLYVYDGVNQAPLGQIPVGTVACGDVSEGKYYYIPSGTDDLYMITLDDINTAEKLADISGNVHSWTFNGDIAVKDGVVYGWGLCGVSGHGYEYFTCNTAGGDFSFTKPNYQSSLQLAFGSDGTLYGHRSGATGAFFEVDESGEVTQIWAGDGNLYTDCASGAICEPNVETAWGAGEGFTGANWATHFMYEITIDGIEE